MCPQNFKGSCCYLVAPLLLLISLMTFWLPFFYKRLLFICLFCFGRFLNLLFLVGFSVVIIVCWFGFFVVVVVF